MNDTSVYVLQLKGGKYYVGKTTDLLKRLKQHEAGNACVWTRIHRFQKCIKVDKVTSAFDENETVKKLMAEYGINNVRGGSYSQVHLPEATMDVLEKEMMAASDRCYVCNEHGHVAKHCPTKKGNYKGRISKIGGIDINSKKQHGFDAPKSCLGFTKKGERCKRTTYLNPMGYCPNHREQGHGQVTPLTTLPGPRPVTVQRAVAPTSLRYRYEHEQACDSYQPSLKRQKRGDQGNFRHPFLEDESHFYDSFESESEDDDTCHRCGRSGHWANECYARSDVHGNRLGKF